MARKNAPVPSWCLESGVSISPQFRIAFLYVALASLWIWLSDRALASLVLDPSQLLWAQSVKGWFFVMLTGVMLYWLIGRDLRRLAAINRRLVRGHEQTLRVLVSAMDIRHKETRDHSDRVMRMAMGLARLAGMHGEALLAVKFGALLHDIGKLAIPDAILIKPGKLDEAEMAHMRRHPEIGRELMEQVDFLRSAIDIPYAHHERWDGGGYPRGLRGEEIPLAARVFSIVDVWDALSFPRVYKPAWPEEEVLAYLRQAAGSQLDPQLIELFLANYPAIKALGMAETDPPLGLAQA
jgi:putative nucleotidyltransferase with HDIG domain